jgi:hypothetical protein
MTPVLAAQIAAVRAHADNHRKSQRAIFSIAAIDALLDEIDRQNKHIAELEKRMNVTFDLVAHLERQRDWSRRTLGPGARTTGIIDHILKELKEIEADPVDLKEWIDVVILAFDGAWRAGWSPEAIAAALAAKQIRNEQRQWPDWRTADPDKAVEHVRE